MKVRVWVDLDITFDTESDGEILPESVISEDAAKTGATTALDAAMEMVSGELVESITDATGFCISGISITVGND